MGMHTETLTTSWYQVTNLDDDLFVTLQLVGDDVVMVFDVSTPDAAATGFTLVESIIGINIPDNKAMYLRCPSGTCDVTYSQFGGIAMDRTKCAHAYTDGVGIDVVVAGNTDVTAGDNDSGADLINNVGFLHTGAAGIAGAATVDSATIRLQLAQFVPGQTIRIYGVAASTSQFSTLVDYADLASGLTLTTEFVDIVVGYTGDESADMTDLLQELVNVGGWTTSSPIQLWVGEPTGTVTGVDYTFTIYTGWTQTAIFATVS